MFRILALMAALFALTACQEEEEGVFTSPDGHRYAFLERPDANIVAIQLAMPMDWSLQAGRNPYVPYIAAEVITTGGADGYPPDVVLETMQDLNAQAFMYPQFNTLRGGINVAPAQLDETVKLANAVLRAPSFDAAWMQRSKDALTANAAQANAQPASLGFYALRLAMMGDTPFTEGQSISTPAAIADITAQQARDWHSQTVQTGQLAIAVAGPISAEKAGQAIDALLAGLPRGDAPFTPVPAAPYKPRQILLHVPQAEKTTLTVLAPIPPAGSPDDMADLVAALVLGADEQSVLFEKIRTELRATYGMKAVLDAFSQQSRVFLVTGEVDTPQTAAARDVIMGIYADMASKPLDATAVENTKQMITGGLPDLHNNTTQLATSMVDAVLEGSDPMVVTQIEQLLTRVTPKAIQDRWAAQFAPVGQVTVLAVSPDADALPGACVITAPRDVLNCP